jgi:hypothetical protein
MNLEITGKLIQKYDTVNVSQSFKKREFVIETSEIVNGNNYTSYAKFQLTNKNVDKIDPHRIGDNVKVSFNVKGNKWEKDGKVQYMTNLEAWRVDKV